VFLVVFKRDGGKLDAKTFRAVLETYIKIDELRFPSNTQDMNRSKYKGTIDAIKKTIDLLNWRLFWQTTMT
jgi:hypothetical protein